MMRDFQPGDIVQHFKRETLSGIGESKAKSIVDYRSENGDFSAIEDITNVSGIGEASGFKNNWIMR